jgi:TRAP-type C4-dicarboxylate transport system permease small subunit
MPEGVFRMRSFLDKLFQGCGVFAAVCLVVIGASVLTGILGRFVGVNVSGAIFVAVYSMGAMAFFALAYTLKSGGHIRVTLFMRQLSPRIRRYFEIWCLVVGTCIFGFLAFNSVLLILHSHEYGITSVGILPIPIWIPQILMAGGTSVASIAFLDELVIVLRGGNPTYGYEEPGEGPEGEKIEPLSEF